MLTASVQLAVMKVSFGQWLRLRRDIVRITQGQIAQELGIRPQTVSNWENGVSRPSLDPDQTMRLCTLLKVSLDELVKAYRGEG